MEKDSPDGLNYIVHHLSKDAIEPPSTADLLDQGRRVLSGLRSTAGWRNVSETCDDAFNFHLRGNLFKILQTAPSVQGIGLPRVSKVLLDWGVPEETTEVFCTADLEEFNSTNLDTFTELPTFSRHISPDAGQGAPHISEDHSASMRRGSGPVLGEHARDEKADVLPPAKRQRVELGSLWRVISQPHVYTTFDLSSDDLVFSPLHDFFKGASPKSVEPYTEETSREYLEDPYARCAWIIPIRGTLPWATCTSASVLPEISEDSQYSGSSVPVPMRFSDGSMFEMVWSRDAIRDFWTFLIDLRAARCLGPLGLSFHAAAPQYASSAAPTTLSRNRLSGSAPPFVHDSSEDSQKGLQASLKSVDHFKIYHDAPQAVRLRNVLQAWSYKHNNGRGEDSVTKVRLLKGATLVLVDETSQGVLTC